MTPWRKFIANFVIFVVLFGQAYDMAFDTEHFPFSAYPMFSYVPTHEMTAHFIYGVAQDGTEFNFMKPEYSAPFKSHLSIQFTLSHLLGDPSTMRTWADSKFTLPYSQQEIETRLRDGLTDFVKRYNNKPSTKSEAKVTGIRLYKHFWKDIRSNAPPERTLMAEVKDGN